jgi:hypothetical protein
MRSPSTAVAALKRMRSELVESHASFCSQPLTFGG